MPQLLSLFFFLILFVSSYTQAAPQYRTSPFTTPKEIKFTEKKELGWKPAASISALYSFGSSENVVGQTDGTTQIFGMSFKGSLTEVAEMSEWRNSLNYSGATSKTPTVPHYVKSSDEFKLETIYLRSLPDEPTIGPFVKADVTTSLFRGEDARSGPTTYDIYNGDGTLRGSQTDTSLPLTDAFRPLTITESVGVFWKPHNDDKMVLEMRAGVGSAQVLAKNQLAIQDKSDTAAIEVVELKSYSQTGIEFGVLFKGKIDEKTMYELNAQSLTPVIKESDESRDSFRLTNFNVSARLSSQITTWMSIGYDYKLKLQPQLIERPQTQQMLVINITYNLF